MPKKPPRKPRDPLHVMLISGCVFFMLATTVLLFAASPSLDRMGLMLFIGCLSLLVIWLTGEG